MTDADKIMRQVNQLPRSISENGKWITISADNWRKFVDRIISISKNTDNERQDEDKWEHGVPGHPDNEMGM